MSGIIHFYIQTRVKDYNTPAIHPDIEHLIVADASSKLLEIPGVEGTHHELEGQREHRLPESDPSRVRLYLNQKEMKRYMEKPLRWNVPSQLPLYENYVTKEGDSTVAVEVRRRALNEDEIEEVIDALVGNLGRRALERLGFD